MRSSLLTEVQHRAADAGLNLFGLVDADRFDAAQTPERRVRALVPSCGTVIVVGSGGRGLWQRFANAPGSAAGAASKAASGFVATGGFQAVGGFANRGAGMAGVDGYAHGIVDGLASMLFGASIRSRVVMSSCTARLPFAKLGEAAGFGTVSPVSGLLIHPEFGPWVRVRAAVLVEGAPFGAVDDASISERFQPCCGCSRPCVAACPAGVHDGLGGSDLARCAQHRHDGNCVSNCGSRSACPVGSEHRDGPGEHAHRHTHPLRSMQRWYGFGVWRFVPGAWRGRP